MLTRWVYRKSHRAMEYPIPDGFSKDAIILELAAQADQHREYVARGYAKYTVSDIDIQPLELARRSYMDKANQFNSGFEEVEFIQLDARKIPYPDGFFDRVIATCLIAHLNEPVDALAEWRRVIRDGGFLSLYVACEPSILLRLARILTRKRIPRKSNLDYDLIHYYQHTISYPAIMEFIKFIFANDTVSIKKYPFRFLPWDFNFWSIVTIQVGGQVPRNLSEPY